MIRMVVLDMAGTTVNENNLVYKTLQKAINEAGFDFTLEQVLEAGAGREKLEAIQNILHVYNGTDDRELAKKIYQVFAAELRTAYKEVAVMPQQHAEKLFVELGKRNIRVILNTGYNLETAQLLLEKLGWVKGRDFDDLITASEVSRGRPNPDMIWLAMSRFEISDAGEVVKVGDSIIDIEEGRNAGCGLSIGITTGAHSLQQLETAKPDYIIHDLIDLLTLI
jgi:phosphonatase-like hydrolase